VSEEFEQIGDLVAEVNARVQRSRIGVRIGADRAELLHEPRRWPSDVEAR